MSDICYRGHFSESPKSPMGNIYLKCLSESVIDIYYCSHSQYFLALVQNLQLNTENIYG